VCPLDQAGFFKCIKGVVRFNQYRLLANAKIKQIRCNVHMAATPNPHSIEIGLLLKRQLQIHFIMYQSNVGHFNSHYMLCKDRVAFFSALQAPLAIHNSESLEVPNDLDAVFKSFKEKYEPTSKQMALVNYYDNGLHQKFNSR
jgi:hypothetical protein